MSIFPATDPGDVKRCIQNELDQYQKDIDLLQNWLKQAKACPASP